MRPIHSIFIERACTPAGDVEPTAIALAKQLGNRELELVFVMAAPEVDLGALCDQLSTKLRVKNIVGTRTAGEICNEGYSTGRVVALGYSAEYFVGGCILVENLDQSTDNDISRRVLKLRQELTSRSPNWSNDFAFCVIDGLSRREDSFVAAVSIALGSTQLIGGSSGDGLDFNNAPIYLNGRTAHNAAVLSILRTPCELKLFREDHFTPSDKRLVVTGAIPEKRLVTEINAEPAAREYARIVGIDPQQLSPFIFAAHPILVRVGDTHHVRAIQRVIGENLYFFSAIDEGMVLTVAGVGNITDHLEIVLSGLSSEQKPEQIFVFDCILRRLEAEQVQQVGNMSRLLAQHNVLGFSTYGEQFNSLHVNQTMTGVAIYPPK